ncbi:MAG: RQC domain-containing protein, partial [Planctomycetota bacterium]
RAGRDGLESRCILLYMPADRFLREYFIDLSYPGPDRVKTVYETLWSLPENPVMRTYKEIADLCEEKTPIGQVGTAIRLLDGAGVTRAFTGGARIAVTLDRPGSEILAKVSGSIQRNVVEGLSAAVDLDAPGRHETSLAHLCSASGRSSEQVRRALSAMDDAGLLRYESPFRGRGIEKCTEEILPFDTLPIDWAHQDFLRGIENEKLEAMEAYIRYPGCRRESILRYFGERDTFRCGMCDRCLPTATASPKEEGILSRKPGVALAVLVCVHHLRFPLGKTRIAQVVCGSKRKEMSSWGLEWNPAHGLVPCKQETAKDVIDDLIREGFLRQEGDPGRPVLALTGEGRRHAESANLGDLLRDVPEDTEPSGVEKTCTEEEIRQAALACVAGLEKPVGVNKIAAILSGSRAKWVKPMGADRLSVYGSIEAAQDRIRDVIRALVKEGILRKGGEDRYPVLELSPSGRRALAAPGDRSRAQATGDKASPRRERGQERADRDSPDPASVHGPSGTLDQIIRDVLSADHDQAKTMLPVLQWYHPCRILEKILASTEPHVSHRARARAVWMVGELCGDLGFAYLVHAGESEEKTIRRLAAVALGKGISAARQASGEGEDLRERAEAMLDRLCEDPEEEVRDAARKTREEP